MGYIVNYYEQIIDITAPQTDVDIQELVNVIRDAEDNFIGMAYPKICEASGKDDLGGGIITGITLYLYPDWQLRFWAGNYTARITGGNLVGGPGDDPVAYTAGVQVVLVQSASSTIVNAAGLTQEQHDKLMTGLDVSIPDAVWDELLATHQAQGSAGRTLTRAEKKATLASLKK
jgi:hypothetical protein